MALSDNQRKALEIACPQERAGVKDGSAIADKIDSVDGRVAASVAAIGATSNLVGVDGTGSNAAPLAGTESRLDVIEAKVDAVIAALKAAGLMSA